MSSNFFRSFGSSNPRLFGNFNRKYINYGFKRYLNYVQGQSPAKGSREYFYYIDHQGMVS